MAPPAAGFNLFGWLAPFVALGGGAMLVVALLRKWQRGPQPAVVSRARAARPDDATDEERARLDAAVRDDE